MKEACRKNDKPLFYFFAYFVGTRLSSHDLRNPEHCHHQKRAILFIINRVKSFKSEAKLRIYFQSAKHFNDFLTDYS